MANPSHEKIAELIIENAELRERAEGDWDFTELWAVITSQQEGMEELEAENDSLATRVSTLESRVKSLEDMLNAK